MTTYQLLMIVISLFSLSIAILSYIHKGKPRGDHLLHLSLRPKRRSIRYNARYQKKEVNSIMRNNPHFILCLSRIIIVVKKGGIQMHKASYIRMAMAVLAALKLVLQPFGIEIGNDLTDAIIGLVAAIIVVISAWKNNFITKHGKAQKELLQKNNLN